MSKSPLAVLGFVFLIATEVASGVSFSLGAILALICILLLIIILLFKHTLNRNFAINVMLILAFSAVAVLNMGFRTYTAQSRVEGLTDRHMRISGVICEPPALAYERFIYILDSDAYGKLRVTSFQNINADLYDRVVADVVFTDYSDTKNNIYAGAYVYGDSRVVSAHEKDLYYYLLKIRVASKQYVDRCLGSSASIVKGIVLGDKTAISHDTNRDFTLAGLAHILVFSGIHFSTVIMLVTRALKMLRMRRWVIRLFTTAVVLFVMVLIGFTPSVMRAGVSALIVILVDSVNKNPDSTTTLGISIIITGLINPHAIISIGFILSVYACLGIVLFAPRIRFKIYRRYFIKNKILKAMIDTAVVTVCAQTAVLPISLAYFGSISFAGFVSYLLIFAAVNLLIMLTVLSLLLHATVILNFIAYPVMYVAGLIADYIKGVAHVIAKLPFSKIDTSVLIMFSALAICIIMLGTAVFYFKKRNIIALSCVLSLILAVFMYAIDVQVNRDLLRITQTDSGSVVINGNGLVVLIGGGENGYALSQIRTEVERSNRAKIDLFIPLSEEASHYTYKNLRPEKMVSRYQDTCYYHSGTEIYTDTSYTIGDLKLKQTNSGVLVRYGRTRIAVVKNGACAADFGKCDLFIGSRLDHLTGASTVMCCTDEDRAKTLALLNDKVYNTYENSVSCYVGKTHLFTVRRN